MHTRCDTKEPSWSWQVQSNINSTLLVYQQDARRRQSHVTGKAVAIGRCNQARDFISQRLLQCAGARWVVSWPAPTLHWRYELWYESTTRARARYRSAQDVVSRAGHILQTRQARQRAGSWETIANLVYMRAASLSVSDWLTVPRPHAVATSLVLFVLFNPRPTPNIRYKHRHAFQQEKSLKSS